MRNDDILEMVDEMLDIEGDVIIGNLTFSRSEIVKRLDPVAYRIIVNEMIDNHIDELRDDMDSLDPELDADEVEQMQEMISDLENSYI
jgi:hypothetical protein